MWISNTKFKEETIWDFMIEKLQTMGQSKDGHMILHHNLTREGQCIGT